MALASFNAPSGISRFDLLSCWKFDETRARKKDFNSKINFLYHFENIQGIKVFAVTIAATLLTTSPIFCAKLLFVHPQHLTVVVVRILILLYW